MKYILLLTLLLAGITLAQTNYVALDGGHVPPFTNWLTAATNIQDAVDLAHDCDLVLVMTGEYNCGGRPAPGQLLTNRLVVTHPITVQSVFGPQQTIIAGAPDSALTNGPQAVRGAYLANGAILSGFTITRGFTMTTGEDDRCGGGVFMISNTVLSNSYVLSNRSDYEGGGVRAISNCLIHTCKLAHNTISHTGGSGACIRDNCTLTVCEVYENGQPYSKYSTLGSIAAFDSILSDCLIYSNYALFYPAAMLAHSVMRRCRILEHTFLDPNVWLIDSTMYDTLISDRYREILTFYGTPTTSMIAGCTLVGYLCDVVDGMLLNTVIVDSSNGGITFDRMYIANCCAPFTNGIDTITGDPQFRDAANGDFRLRRDSPCINAGTNVAEMGAWDLDGQPRVRGCRVDIGAYEFVTTGACIAATERVIDFGHVLVGDTATSAVRVVNLGDEPVVGMATNVYAPFAIIAGAGYTVQSDAYHDVTLAFTPPAEGVYSNTILLQSGGDCDVLLRGTGVPELSVIMFVSYMGYALFVMRYLSA